MKNWQESIEFERVKPFLEPGDFIDMPEIATGAFKLIRNGKTYKLRKIHNEYEYEAARIHQELWTRGWNLPGIQIKTFDDGNRFSLVNWWEGMSAREYKERYHYWPENYYYKLGEMAAKFNNTFCEGKHVSVLNYWPRNILVRPDESLVYIDLNKLYLTDYPEAFIEKCIITDDPVSFPEREEFLEGYRKHRPYDIKKILKWHIDHVYLKYEDIWLDRQLFFKGIRGTKNRIEMMKLPKDMTDWNVLDLGCSGGMFSLECAQRGAKYVYGCDNRYVNIRAAHHRLSDMTKLIAYYHGFHGANLHFKHIDINTDHFIEEHIPEIVKNRGRFNVIFALAIVDHLDLKRREKMYKMLSENTDLLYWESRQGGRREVSENVLRKYTTFPNIEYIGNPSTHDGKFEYALFKCWR